MTNALHRTLSAARLRAADPDWIAAAGRIEQERIDAEAVLDRGERVYGFTTMLGHLDDAPADAQAQEVLLSAHLVGPRDEAPAGMLDLLSAAKAEQLSHGGSGVRPTTYRAVLDAFGDEPAMGSWLSSYSSGDVVPAAWWASARVIPKIRPLAAGDVITLINGSFFAAAHASLAWAAATTALVEALRRYAAVAPVRSGTDPDLAALARVFATEQRGDVQPPVSLRDAGPAVRTIVRALRDTAGAIDHRLGNVSANPVFENGHAHSQSSFLDFELTRALGGLQLAVQLASGIIQRLITHGVDADDPFGVQPPKISRALLLRDPVPGAYLFTGADSRGIEDVRDLALNASTEVLRSVETLRALLDIHDDAVPEGQLPATADVGAVLAGLIGTVDFDEILHWAGVAARTPA